MRKIRHIHAKPWEYIRIHRGGGSGGGGGGKSGLPWWFWLILIVVGISLLDALITFITNVIASIAKVIVAAIPYLMIAGGIAAIIYWRMPLLNILRVVKDLIIRTFRETHNTKQP